MLPKTNRLTKKNFKNVFGKKVFHTPFFTVHALSPSQIATYTDYKCSVVVTKKHAKKATERNSLRRYHYAALTAAIQDQNTPQGFFIFFVKQNPTFEILIASYRDFFIKNK